MASVGKRVKRKGRRKLGRKKRRVRSARYKKNKKR